MKLLRFCLQTEEDFPSLRRNTCNLVGEVMSGCQIIAEEVRTLQLYLL
jgi:hypothetical protein